MPESSRKIRARWIMLIRQKQQRKNKMERKNISLRESSKFMDQLREKFYFKREIEKVKVVDSLGRELAEPLISKYESPLRDTATMDGFAVRSEDTNSYPLKIAGSIYAGDKEEYGIKKGEAMGIATGAYLPEGSDAVLRVEDSKIEDDNLLYGIPLKEGKYVIFAGTDYKKGEIILKKGHKIRAQDITVLSGLCVSEISVYKKFRVAVFSNGNEICSGLIRDTNSPMIMAFLKEFNCDPAFIGTVPDDFEQVKKKIIESTEYDMAVTSGGVSVGEKDYVIDAISELGEVVMHKVNTRPGKPLAVGIINKKLIFGLPGKPSGAFIAIELNLRRFFGAPPRPTRKYPIAENINILTPGFDYVVFFQIKNGKAIPMGCEGSPLNIFRRNEPYNVSVVASSPRSLVSDGYVITKTDLHKGDFVDVNLFF
ncbi:MAG: hypothetical protein A7315_01235 [Candidatus Altiarchaeales archaeon WOR_SM1_79]|nr:MAG: hypothetical protein A7315_01235 [Candidatus Altiarchaeales archaeon WOR_SM1_79]